MVDSIYRTRSLGVAAEGLPDQYADGNTYFSFSLTVSLLNMYWFNMYWFFLRGEGERIEEISILPSFFLNFSKVKIPKFSKFSEKI